MDSRTPATGNSITHEKDFADNEEKFDIEKLNVAFQRAKKAYTEHKDFNAALMYLRRFAEDVQRFYINHWLLSQSYNELCQKLQAQDLKKSEVQMRMFTLREGVGNFNEAYPRDLLIFLELARRYGNKAVHEQKTISRCCAQFLIEFYENNVKKTLEKDVRLGQASNDILDTNVEKTLGKNVQFEQETNGFLDVTNKIAGRTFTIISYQSGRFVTSKWMKIHCNFDQKAEEKEKFTAEPDGNGFVHIRDWDDRYFSVVEMSREVAMVYAYPRIAEEKEKFKIFRTGNVYCIQARCNGKWLSCGLDHDCGLEASSERVNRRECFDIKFCK